jgi:hypothetical protein
MIVESLFGQLAKQQNLQAMLDNSLTTLYGQSVWRNFLGWNLPQISLTFEGLKLNTRLVSAASVVDIDSPAPLRGNDTVGSYTGKIPSFKEKFSLDQKEYRLLQQLQLTPISDGEKKRAFMEALYSQVTSAVKSTDERMDIMWLEIMSTMKVNVNIANNPDGVVLAEVDFLTSSQRTEQVKGVAKVWSDPTADVIKDVRNTVTAARLKGKRFDRILVTPELWAKIEMNTSVSEYMKAYFNPGSNARYVVSQESINTMLAANSLPRFEVIDTLKVIEKDGKQQVITPFAQNNAVFLPAGKLGSVHNALAIEEMEPIPGVNYAKYDRTLLKKWRDNDPWREYTEVELNAFPFPDRAEEIYILETNVVQA